MVYLLRSCTAFGIRHASCSNTKSDELVKSHRDRLTRNFLYASTATFSKMSAYQFEIGSKAGAEDARTEQVSQELKRETISVSHFYDAILNPSKCYPHEVKFNNPESECFFHVIFKTETLSPDQKHLNTSQMMNIKDTDLKLEIDGENRMLLDGTRLKKVHGGNGENRFHYTEGKHIRPREATTAVRKFKYWHRQFRIFLSKNYTSAVVAKAPLQVTLIMRAPIGPMGEADCWAEIVRHFGTITLARMEGLSVSLVVDLPRCEYASQGLFARYASELRKLKEKYPDRIRIEFESTDMLEVYKGKPPHEVKDADKETRHRNNIEFLQKFMRDHLHIGAETNQEATIVNKGLQFDLQSDTTVQANSQSGLNPLAGILGVEHFWAPETAIRHPNLHGDASVQLKGYFNQNSLGDSVNVENLWEPDNKTGMNDPGFYSGAPIEMNSYSEQNSLGGPNNLEYSRGTSDNNLSASFGNTATPYYQNSQPLPTMDKSQSWYTGYPYIPPPSSRNQSQNSYKTGYGANDQVQPSSLSTVPLWGDNTQGSWNQDVGNPQNVSGTFGSSQLSAKGPTTSIQPSYDFSRIITAFPDLSGYDMTGYCTSSTNDNNFAGLNTGRISQTNQDSGNDVWRVDPSVSSLSMSLIPQAGNKRGRQDDDEIERPGKKLHFLSPVSSIPQTGMVYDKTDGAKEVDLSANMAPQHETQYPVPATPFLPMMSTPNDDYGINPVQYQHFILQNMLGDSPVNPGLDHQSS